MESIVRAIEGTAINEWILSSAWLWPTLEILHFLGLSLLIGSLLIIDLRLFGWFRQIQLSVVHKLLSMTFLGFALNLATGILFVLGDPARYAANVGFRWKMFLILVAGVNAIWFFRRINPTMAEWDPHGDTSLATKVVAFVSLGAWTGVLLLGRLIPYIGTG
ncbi:MAG: hypothetical protein AAF417_07065 [Pseudomonadota bacterium]